MTRALWMCGVLTAIAATTDARLVPRAGLDLRLGGARGFSRAAGDRRNGRVQTFWPNGRLKSDVHYKEDAYEGEYRTWYENGAPYEMRYYVAGHEAGMQQSWTLEGVLYLNYEVRNGRRYGLVNAAPCATVESVGTRDGSAYSADLRTEDRPPYREYVRAPLPYYDNPQFTPRWAPVAHRIGSFRLTRQTGDAISDRDLRGRDRKSVV